MIAFLASRPEVDAVVKHWLIMETAENAARSPYRARIAAAGAPDPAVRSC